MLTISNWRWGFLEPKWEFNFQIFRKKKCFSSKSHFGRDVARRWFN